MITQNDRLIRYLIVEIFLGGFILLHMVNLYHFACLIIADAHTHAHYVLYNQAYFVVVVRRSSLKTAIIGPLENFPLNGIIIIA